jgi:peroxiredoxin
MRCAMTIVICALGFIPAAGQETSSPAKGVMSILAAHDRALIKELLVYLEANPKAADLEQAYMEIFERAIENDWYTENEALARKYLEGYPQGAVRPLAQIVATMARAQTGKFDEAWTIYRDLMRSLDQDNQEEFAANFADSLASSAATAGEYEIAKRVYDALLKQFGTSPTLRQKVKDDLNRLEMVGKPAPQIAVKDIDGKLVRSADLAGKYVLIDFWATFAASSVAELPHLQAAYASYHAKGLEIVSVSLDESPRAVSDFVRARKVPWRQIHNSTSGGDLVEAFGVNNIPASFLIDPQGKIVRLELRGKALDKALAALLK